MAISDLHVFRRLLQTRNAAIYLTFVAIYSQDPNFLCSRKHDQPANRSFPSADDWQRTRTRSPVITIDQLIESRAWQKEDN